MDTEDFWGRRKKVKGIPGTKGNAQCIWCADKVYGADDTGSIFCYLDGVEIDAGDEESPRMFCFNITPSDLPGRFVIDQILNPFMEV